MENVKQADFKSKIESGTVLVDFWAPWCGPCRAQGAILEELKDNPNWPKNVTVLKVNVDEEPDLAAEYKIQLIPTLIIFKEGKMVSRMSNTQSADALILALKNS